MQIGIPAYVLSCREDHIVPWQTAYITTRLISGEVRFTLAASGHIAGVINPASRNKRSFWIDGELGKPERWLETAREMPGSWWTDWSAWLRTHAGDQVSPSAILGNARFPEIEAAPGRYVRAHSD
jgi:polyhydroxyalkanoate synthase